MCRKGGTIKKGTSKSTGTRSVSPRPIPKKTPQMPCCIGQNAWWHFRGSEVAKYAVLHRARTGPSVRRHVDTLCSTAFLGWIFAPSSFCITITMQHGIFGVYFWGEVHHHVPSSPFALNDVLEAVLGRAGEPVKRTILAISIKRHARGRSGPRRRTHFWGKVSHPRH